MQVLPLTDHAPTVGPPWVGIRQQKIAGKAQVHQLLRLHFVFAVLLPFYRGAKPWGLHDLASIDPALCIPLVDVAEFAALAIPVAATPWVPTRHRCPLFLYCFAAGGRGVTVRRVV
ncbi:hypothetical protein SDC9_166127 [bioreactor metagenome]|uniref:Uncharacterized protein n=1 Tax=bioreactor metagenome TaxID=1076179 RepID=A0A645G3Q2_9ZZZZ